jgi:hypothetical protein
MASCKKAAAAMISAARIAMSALRRLAPSASIDPCHEPLSLVREHDGRKDSQSEAGEHRKSDTAAYRQLASHTDRCRCHAD